MNGLKPANQYLDNPGWNLPTRDEMHTIACRLIHQTKGTIPGLPKRTLNIEQAAHCVQYSLSLKLNPFADIHIWFDKKLIVCPHYRIIVGWAQHKEPYTDTYRILSQEERRIHQVTDNDIANICYVLKKSHHTLFGQCLANGLKKQEALEIAASSAVGIVQYRELWDKEGLTRIAPPKGWSWQQRSETRALRNAIGRSHGNPTSHDINAFTTATRPHYNPKVFAHSDFKPEWPPEAQENYITLADNPPPSESTEAMSLEERVVLLRGEEGFID